MRGAVTEARVRKLAEYWLRRYGLWPFQLTILITTSEDGDEGTKHKLAEIEVMDGYRSGSLTVWEKRVSVRELNRLIFHEISHIVHWRAFDWLLDLTRERDSAQVTKMREDVVSHLEIAMFPRTHRR